MNNIRRQCLFSWQIPLLGSGLTFILGLGFSYSNRDIRLEVQLVALIVFTVLVLIGAYYTVQAFSFCQRYKNKNYLKHAITGLSYNFYLIFVVAISISAIHTLNYPPNTKKHSIEEFKRPSTAFKLPIWILSHVIGTA